MNETVTWPVTIPDLESSKKISARKVIRFLALVMLLSGLGICAWITFPQFSHVAFWALMTTALGVVGFAQGHHRAEARWQRRLTDQLQARDIEWRKASAGAHSQLIESRATEEELRKSEAAARKEATDLGFAKSQLEAELNQLKRAEKNLSQQRQSLEVSKSVLEIHVEARTKELAKLQRRYELILNSAGEGICGFDVDGRTTFVNPTVAKLTGWDVKDLIGKTEQEIFGLKQKGRKESDLALKAGEQIFYRKDSTPIAVEFVRSPINENGQTVGSVLLFKDVTARKRAEETLAQRAAELSRSNAELEQFAFVASHDLQEPLRKIQAFGDRLKTKCQGAIAAEAHDYLERMQNASARMRTLIDDLLTFSRVIRSSEPFVPVDLVKMTKEVLGDLEVRMEKTGARVEVGELPTIEADPLQMRQLMLNLLSNALKFQSPGASPVVKITARAYNLPSGEAMCELSVKDNGIGFDEKYLEKIFAVFQRLHGRTEYEGTGVGLAVCRRITDRHHGAITARSEPGQGSTFIVALPVRQPKSQTPK
jgi:PAS domain S-box-containing protein